MKAGWKTTEFWMVVVSAILMVMVAGGYVTVEESEAISSAVAETINAVANLAVSLAPVAGMIMYIWSRGKVKSK